MNETSNDFAHLVRLLGGISGFGGPNAEVCARDGAVGEMAEGDGTEIREEEGEGDATGGRRAQGVSTYLPVAMPLPLLLCLVDRENQNRSVEAETERLARHESAEEVVGSRRLRLWRDHCDCAPRDSAVVLMKSPSVILLEAKMLSS